MLAWLALTLGISFSSALIPFISIELFIVTVAANEPQLPWLALGAVVALGQVAGKLLYYFAARGSIRLPAFLHRKPKIRQMTPRRMAWQLRTKRVRGWIERLKEKCEKHPHWMLTTYSLSAVVGLPPYMAMTVLAGLVRMRIAAFIGAGLAGRFIRFSMLAASPALFAGWFL